MILRPLLTSSIVWLSLLLSTLHAKKDSPTVSVTTFENALESVFYFDDSNVILGLDVEEAVVYRTENAGETWKKVEDEGQAGNVWDIWPHPWDNQRAYVLGIDTTHWMTKDQGKTWTKFDSGSLALLNSESPFSFHGRDPQKVIWNGESCKTVPCQPVAFYTTDDFKHTVSLTDKTRGGCVWAVGSSLFAEKAETNVEDRIFCVKEGLYSRKRKDYRLTYSDDYYGTQDIEPTINEGRTVAGIISMAATKRYLVAAAKSVGSDELALYVTMNGSQWHRAEFGEHRIEEDAYTILESTNYSMQVDVLGSKPMNPMGFLFTSNYNGTYFTRNVDYTNRSPLGRVDFEKAANIQGIVLVNTVKNWEKVQNSLTAGKEIISQISFDDGRTFQSLSAGEDNLHLHSVTTGKQGGRIFSSPAPGIMMGVGNTGRSLKGYADGDLYVSDDAGVTWSKAINGAHLYEFGNQGAVLAAIDNEDNTDHIRYSLDHGKTFKKANLGKKIRAKFLTTVPDSTTLKFLLIGTSREGGKLEWQVFKIDFEGLHERTCESKDFEDKWPARVNEKGEPSCIMGHKQFFRRRKADSECVIEGEFKDPVPTFEPCTCTEADFECDFNFKRSSDRKECEPVHPIPIPEGECKNPDDKFMGSSGWRKIPGNECQGGLKLDQDKEHPCTDGVDKNPGPSGNIAVEKTAFKASRFVSKHYLERVENGQGEDETVIMQTDEREIYLTKNHGKTWRQVLKDEPIVGILPNPHFYDRLYFLTGNEKVHYTIDRGDNFGQFDAKLPPSTDLATTPMKFHPVHKDWILWAGLDGTNRQTNYYYSSTRGDSWEMLLRSAEKCDFIRNSEKDKLIFCKAHEVEDPQKPLQLVSSDNFFTDSTVHFKDILDFATMSEFIVVAQKTEDRQSLKVDASVNGDGFAEAEFPKNFKVEHQQAYTVLESSTHAVFMHVTVNPAQGQEYGTIVKSNSNGTSYVKILDYVNRDTPGYVDFEKMQQLDGVIMVNLVSNPDGVGRGEKKLLKSKISHNDGFDWDLLAPPKKDAVGGTYECVRTDGKAEEDCSLHIHSYTERSEKAATFSSPSAVGLMMAVGNVGPHLLRLDDSETDTFITRDAGLTWKSVKKGRYMWEYGDQGSIIVIVKEMSPTKTIFYTLDEGATWREFEFSKIEMEISSITTVPSDSSRNFLLWGRETGPGSKTGTIMTVNLDFSGLKERFRECKLDDNHVADSPDFDLWEPRHPYQRDNCLFGHVAQYHRKKIDADCYVGHYKDDGLHRILRNCTCTREDFECAYNFQKQGDGTCGLVEGAEEPDYSQVCKDDPSRSEWYKSAYRRIPISTCQGGVEFDKTDPQPCPGHEEEFGEKHGGRLGGVAVFFIVVISIAGAGGIGYWVWDQYQKQGGWGGLGFGQIRLGDGLGGGSSGGRGESMLITIPVAIISGVVAVGKALPLLATSLFRSARGYVPLGSRAGTYGGSGPYRSRDAFASRRPDYSSPAYVEDDELLGEDDEDIGDEV